MNALKLISKMKRSLQKATLNLIKSKITEKVHLVQTNTYHDITNATLNMKNHTQQYTMKIPNTILKNHFLISKRGYDQIIENDFFRLMTAFLSGPFNDEPFLFGSLLNTGVFFFSNLTFLLPIFNF